MNPNKNETKEIPNKSSINEVPQAAVDSNKSNKLTNSASHERLYEAPQSFIKTKLIVQELV